MSESRATNRDRIGRLLRLAGPRPGAPPETERRVHAAVHEVWRERVRWRRRRRVLVRGGLAMAAAASVIAVLGALYWPLFERAPAYEGPVATVEAISGPVRTWSPDARLGTPGAPLRVGDTVVAGAVVDTGVLGRAALRLTGGHSVRLDFGTRLEPASPGSLVLERGALYFDSGPAAAASDPVIVRTPLGAVQDIGTQFEVRLDEERIRVRVREGSVHLDHDEQSWEAGAGVELTLDTSGSLSRRSVPIYGPDWNWILDVAPAFELEGSTLEAFLAWVSRETGWTTRFAAGVSGTPAAEIVLYGTIEGMRPDEALDAVLPTCGLAHRLQEGTLVLEAAES